MEHDPHTGFIIAAYVMTGLVVLSMIVVIVSDYRTLRQSLTRFGARGDDRE